MFSVKKKHHISRLSIDAVVGKDNSTMMTLYTRKSYLVQHIFDWWLSHGLY